MLIDDEGRLDTAHISQIVKDLHDDSNLPRHHRAHLIRTLEQLQANPELASTINSVCEQKPLRGPAAGMVRATLNLPFDHAAPAKGEARKALVMSLLGDLRQREVGSCFATAPAICLLDSSPEIVARHMKELLEENRLTVRNEGAESEVPLNQCFSRAQAQILIDVQADGTCNKKTTGGPTQPYKLHETPGMQGALTALGIAPEDMEQAMITALGGLGASRNGFSRFSSRQILEELARNCPDAKKGFASALNAFVGKEEVMLLRAWEYTLASAAEARVHSEMIDEIAMATLFGKPIAGKPELQSLSSRNDAYQNELRSDLRFRSAPLDKISQQLFDDIQDLMQQRFCLLYDADVPHNTISADGVSRRGGFRLYDRVPAHDPSKWQRIDYSTKFGETMVQLVRQASDRTSDSVGSMPGDQKTNSAALKNITRNLTNNIGTNAFFDHIALSMNPRMAKEPSVDLSRCNRLPWKHARGSNHSDSLLNDLGAKFLRFANRNSLKAQDSTPSANADGGPRRPGDATHVIEFFCNALKQMEPALRDKASRAHRDFKVPVGTASHLFSLMPMAFEDAWKDASGNPKQWMHDKLEQPAFEYLQMQRTEPPLLKLLESLGQQLGADHQKQFKEMYQQIAHIRKGGESYSLRRVHQVVAEYCQRQPDGAGLLGTVEDHLVAMLPVPAIPFADTNWSSAAGEATLVEASYNPFKKRVEAHIVKDGGSNRRLINQSWLDGKWDLSTPLAPAVEQRDMADRVRLA